MDADRAGTVTAARAAAASSMAANTGTAPSMRIRQAGASGKIDCTVRFGACRACGIGGDLLGRRALGRTKAGQPVLAAGVAAEVAGHQDRVDVVAGLEHRVCAGIAVRVHLARARQVDGIGDLGLRPQRIAEARLGGRAQRRDVESGGLGHVAGDHAVPAAVGQHRDAPSAWHGSAAQREQYVGQFARGRNPDRAGHRARRGDHRRVAGQRAGVRLGAARRSGAGPAASTTTGVPAAPAAPAAATKPRPSRKSST